MKISILGAGYVGRSLSAAAVKAGHQAMISNSRGPQTLFSETALIGCEAGTIEEAAAFGDVVVVAIPLKHYQAVPVAPLAGKVVIDSKTIIRAGTPRSPRWTPGRRPAASYWRRTCRNPKS